VVLRFGVFYAPDSTHSQAMVRAARRRIGLAVGSPHGYMSSIHGDDAAAAVLAVLDADAGVYNVVDDEPVTRRAYFAALGAAVGHARPFLFPGRAARLTGKRASTLTRSQRVTNAAFKAETGWAPRYPSVREGWPAVVAAEHGRVLA
jgi:nucleoside-diphosphate-sugar epimerase